VAGGQLSARLLDASYGPVLQEINRACPIVSRLTFWFDRGEDFFRWPELVYDRFFYVGIFAGDDLVGYCMAGLTRAWTGRDLGWLAVLGDARVLPEHRGLGWIDVALEKLAEVVPRPVALGLFIINEGNRAADHLRNRFRLEGYDMRPAGRLTVQNLLVMRRRRRVPGVAVTAATPADLDSLARFLQAQWHGRLFAPETSPPALENSIRRPGLGWERTYLARRDEEIAGVLGAWDTGAFHATRVISYSAAATIARGVHAAARTLLREAAPLPEPGEAFRSLTITNLAVSGRDPSVLRALLTAVNNDHLSQGYHLMHLGATAGQDWAPALRSWPRQRFSSSLYAITRTGGPQPPAPRRTRPPARSIPAAPCEQYHRARPTRPAATAVQPGPAGGMGQESRDGRALGRPAGTFAVASGTSGSASAAGARRVASAVLGGPDGSPGWRVARVLAVAAVTALAVWFTRRTGGSARA
jgi:Acetyltransferase (GNAT) domain